MKRVVSNSMVVHLWANQSQPEARSNNRSFSGGTLYSYSTVVAAINRVGTEDVALISDRTHSVTTAKMLGEVRGAVSHMTQFTVPYLRPHDERDHAKNLAHLVKQYHETVATMLRKVNDPGDWMFSRLGEMRDAAACYARTFALPETDLPHVADVERIQARFNDPKRVARRQAREARDAAAREQARIAYEARRKIELLDAAERIVMWRNGEIATHMLPWAARSLSDGTAMVRISSGMLQTSQGAEVPLDHAIRVFHRVAACRAAGITWHRNGDTIRVGQFQVDAIAADGSFTAGCHRFNWEEIATCFAQAVAEGVV